MRLFHCLLAAPCTLVWAMGSAARADEPTPPVAESPAPHTPLCEQLLRAESVIPFALDKPEARVARVALFQPTTAEDVLCVQGAAEHDYTRSEVASRRAWFAATAGGAEQLRRREKTTRALDSAGKPLLMFGGTAFVAGAITLGIGAGKGDDGLLLGGAIATGAGLVLGTTGIALLASSGRTKRNQRALYLSYAGQGVAMGGAF